MKEISVCVRISSSRFKLLRTQFLLVLSLLILVFSPALTCASYYNNSLHIILQFKSCVYHPGDVVNFTLYVFDKGVASDATVYINISDEVIPVTQLATGIYVSQYIIPYFSYSYLVVRVTAIKGGDMEYISRYLYVKTTPEDKLVSELYFINPEQRSAEPNELVEFIAELRYNTELVDGDTVRFSWQEKKLHYTHLSHGRYKSSFLVPWTTVSTYYIISFEATYSGLRTTATLLINMDFYNIWYHRIALQNNVLEFEVCVADREGKAVPNALVDITATGTMHRHIPSYLYGFTNSSGMCRFNLSVENEKYFMIDGRVTVGNKSQRLTTYLQVAESVPTQSFLSSQFFLVSDRTNCYDYPLNTAVSRRYAAYSQNYPLLHKTIYYYITAIPLTSTLSPFYWTENFVAAGSELTDDTGNLTLNFVSPAEPCIIRIVFEAAFPFLWKMRNFDDFLRSKSLVSRGDADDDMYYLEFEDYFYVGAEAVFWSNKAVSLTVSEFRPGSKATVTITVRDEAASRHWIAGFFVGDEKMFSSYLQQFSPLMHWQCWSGYAQVTVFGLSAPGPTFAAKLTIPSFLPANSNYTVYGGYSESSGLVKCNHLVLRIEQGTDGVDGNEVLYGELIPGWMIALIFIVTLPPVVIVGIAIGLRKERRKKAVLDKTKPEPGTGMAVRASQHPLYSASVSPEPSLTPIPLSMLTKGARMPAEELQRERTGYSQEIFMHAAMPAIPAGFQQSAPELGAKGYYLGLDAPKFEAEKYPYLRDEELVAKKPETVLEDRGSFKTGKYPYLRKL